MILNIMQNNEFSEVFKNLFFTKIPLKLKKKQLSLYFMKGEKVSSSERMHY